MQSATESIDAARAHAKQRKTMGDRCATACAKSDTGNAGTLEFLYQDKRVLLHRMTARSGRARNRIVTGIDIVKAQLLIAAGTLPYGQNESRSAGTPGMPHQRGRSQNFHPIAGPIRLGTRPAARVSESTATSTPATTCRRLRLHDGKVIAYGDTRDIFMRTPGGDGGRRHQTNNPLHQEIFNHSAFKRAAPTSTI